MNPKPPIAIIGIGCRFPGAPDPASFWRLLVEGREAISPVPKDRWDIDEYYDPDPLAPGMMNTRCGGFIENVDHFDARFFGISPREAACMDPQQRILLEVAWEALQDAGLVAERLARSPVGVFMGVSSFDYGRADTNPNAIEAYMGTGNAGSINANRLSYLFDFRGPSMVVDTACSSALVAAHLACNSLWAGESSVAIVGGANVILSPTITITFTKAGMMASDGHCKAFDASANGYVRGEGVGVVVLKPLPNALADGDPVYALIRATAVNQDGRSNGITAPNREAQEAVIREACANAGISPGELDYVETHGTGTSLGDPIEARALGNILSEGRPAGQPCAIGSVKTNIGHLEAAAGIASLIKVALALRNRQIPASLHFRNPNPLIPFDELPIRVQQSLGRWPQRGRASLAGVNSFGFGGTNAHIIVEELPPASFLSGRATRGQAAGEAVGRPVLLPVSAQAGEELRQTAERYREFLDAAGAEKLEDICFTAGARHTHHEHRLVVMGRSPAELAGRLRQFRDGQSGLGVYSGQTQSGHGLKLAFVFPGQGQQWYAMGRQLVQREPVFRDTLHACDSLFRSWAPWSLMQELMSGEAESRLNQTEFAQPAVFSLQVALAELWRSWGLMPEAVIGHSMGEVAAAYFAGMLTLHDAACVIFHRARLMQRATGMGRMAAVRAPLERVERLIDPYRDVLSVAACNAPGINVISGDTGALERVLENAGPEVDYQYLPVRYAFHSPQMSGLQGEILDALQGLSPAAGETPMISTVTGEALSGVELDAPYWWSNVRRPVLFSAGIGKLLALGINAFVEISSHPTLLSAISECAAASGADVSLFPSLRRNADEQEQMLASLAALHIAGHEVQWRALYPRGVHTALPANVWDRQPFWHPGIARGGARAVLQTPAKHPLLGRRLDSATPVWECEYGVRRLPYLAEHRVQGKTVYPAAGYLETALAAFIEVAGRRRCVLSDVKFRRPLTLPESGIRRVETVVTLDGDAPETFRIYSFPGADDKAWTLHSEGRYEAAGEDAAPVEPDFPEAILRRSERSLTSAECYQRLAAMGLEYGDSFQGIDRIWIGPNEALARIRIPAAIQAGCAHYHVHPALLDACGQVLLASAERAGRAMIPAGVDRVRWYDAPVPDQEVWVHARIPSPDGMPTQRIAGDVWILDGSGRILAEVEGLQVENLETASSPERERVEDWFYRVEWRPAALPPSNGETPPPGSWLLLAGPDSLWKPLAGRLSALGQYVSAVFYDPQDPSWEERIAEAVRRDVLGSGAPPRGVVHLCSVPESEDPAVSVEALEAAPRRDSLAVIGAIRQIAEERRAPAPRLWLVTRKAQAVTAGSGVADVAAAPLWGLGPVINIEYPELRCTNVDIESLEDAGSLAREICAGDGETRIAFRSGERFVARLVRLDRPESTAECASHLRIPAGAAFRVDVSAPGSIANLRVSQVSREPLAADQIEVEVEAAGLNFRDVMKVLGIYPSAPGDPFWLGDECAGTVTRVADGVAGFQPGDKVLAIAPRSMGRYTRLPAGFAAHIPNGLSVQEAAAIPIAFTTAWHAFRHLARLEAGETVLIHAAAGGVGLAAVQLAFHLGAKVIATAGSPEKRDYLRSLGVEHVFDSRSLAFADQIAAVTKGKGVDVVLNSLGGAAIPRSLSILGAYGRFVEIGKRDIFQNSKIGLAPFRNNLAFYSVDMEKVFRERPAFAAKLLEEVVGLFREGSLKPLPCRVFPMSDAASGFRYLAQARNTGKVVFSFAGTDQSVAETDLVRPDRTYLIAGGLGGIGLAVARWLVGRGATHLALIGRRAPGAPAEAILNSEIRPRCRVETVQADLSSAGQVRAAISGLRQKLPPLAGVVHAAGVLQDERLLNMNEERFRAVLGPKVQGAWNLHSETLHDQLDFFLLFSSMASVFGSPGQANYAAANAFLDALAHYRRKLGLPASAVNWGPWSEIGMAAGMSDARLAEAGMARIPPEPGLDALDRLLSLNLAQTVVVRLNAQQWARQRIFAGAFFQELQPETSGDEAAPANLAGIRRTILEADPRDRQTLLESFMVAELSRVLQIDAARIDVHSQLDALGLDSLMAIEFKHRLDSELGVELSILSLLDGASISEIATQFLEAVALTPSGVPMTGAVGASPA